MAIAAIMHKQLITATPDETVATAAQRMREHRLGAVLVLEGKKLAGVFSERDLLMRVVAEGKDPRVTTVGEVATPNPVTVKASAEIEVCYQIIKERGFRHLPVVDDAGVPVGIISARDFLQLMVVGMSRQVDMESFFDNIGSLDLDMFGA
jgi:CBS domain-containing protein